LKTADWFKPDRAQEIATKAGSVSVGLGAVTCPLPGLGFSMMLTRRRQRASATLPPVIDMVPVPGKPVAAEDPHPMSPAAWSPKSAAELFKDSTPDNKPDDTLTL
jgi:hypothetical protein